MTRRVKWLGLLILTGAVGVVLSMLWDEPSDPDIAPPGEKEGNGSHSSSTSTDEGLRTVSSVPFSTPKLWVHSTGHERPDLPIARALISVRCTAPEERSFRLLSDESGCVDLGVAPPGKYTVQILAPGHVGASADLVIHETRTAPSDIWLSQYGTVSGVVTGPVREGKARLAQASQRGASRPLTTSLRLVHPDDRKALVRPEAKVGAAGRFVLDRVWPGVRLHLSVESLDKGTWRRELVRLDPGEVRAVSVQLTADTGIRGRVPTTAPPSSAELILTRRVGGSGWRDEHRLVTKDEEFSFRDISPGTWVVSFRRTRPGYLELGQTLVEVPRGEIVDVGLLPVEPSSVRFTVDVATAREQEGEFSMTALVGSRRSPIHAKFRITGFPKQIEVRGLPASHILTTAVVRSTNGQLDRAYLPAKSRIDFDGGLHTEAVSIQLRATKELGKIRITLAIPAGVEADEFDARVCVTRAGRAVRAWSFKTGQSTFEGEFEVGTYAVHAVANGFSAGPATADVSTEDTTAVSLSTWRPARSFSGRVVNSGGLNLSGAHIRVFQDSGKAVGHRELSSVRADPDGNFTIAVPALDGLLIQATAQGHAPSDLMPLSLRTSATQLLLEVK